jgi:HAD superfamily hydrolase (TIGR01484 family)
MMGMGRTRLIAMDLDGTLTQHKSPLPEETRATLERLGKSYRMLMVGAGSCRRIFNQMDSFPIDIVGNYGLQYARYDATARDLAFVRDEALPCDRESVLARANAFRASHGLTEFAGDSVEFHGSGVVTFALLGTKALQEDKLAYDPDRLKRRAILGEVKDLFPEYNVFVGGSSSFDMAPRPYDKAHALSLICAEDGIAKDDVLYVGDDYGPGGNDEAVLLSGFPFLKIDDYRTTPEMLVARLAAE